jgi:UDPglucose 6-dehydrogenase
VAFKPGSDDVRDSPALEVAKVIYRQGARVSVYDPADMDRARQACPELSTRAPLSALRPMRTCSCC